MPAALRLWAAGAASLGAHCVMERRPRGPAAPRAVRRGGEERASGCASDRWGWHAARRAAAPLRPPWGTLGRKPPLCQSRWLHRNRWALTLTASDEEAACLSALVRHPGRGATVRSPETPSAMHFGQACLAPCVWLRTRSGERWLNNMLALAHRRYGSASTGMAKPVIIPSRRANAVLATATLCERRTLPRILRSFAQWRPSGEEVVVPLSTSRSYSASIVHIGVRSHWVHLGAPAFSQSALHLRKPRLQDTGSITPRRHRPVSLGLSMLAQAASKARSCDAKNLFFSRVGGVCGSALGVRGLGGGSSSLGASVALVVDPVPQPFGRFAYLGRGELRLVFSDTGEHHGTIRLQLQAFAELCARVSEFS